VDAPSTNAELLKQYVEASERKDWEAATAFWADDVVLHVQGRNPLAGDFGQAALPRALRTALR
jgi:ketosteroid isomerase-like protein